MAAKEEQNAGKIQGVLLPNSNDRQLVSQYADDLGMSIIALEDNLRATVTLINCFEAATGLLVNWTKSVGYWFASIPRPPWIDLFDLIWALPSSLSTLLGTPFAITLATTDIDNFLHQKIKIKFLLENPTLIPSRTCYCS